VRNRYARKLGPLYEIIDQILGDNELAPLKYVNVWSYQPAQRRPRYDIQELATGMDPECSSDRCVGCVAFYPNWYKVGSV
jgi:hypothetical protein